MRRAEPWVADDDVVSAADLEAWRAVAADLSASPGVHRPSGFSAALAASLPELDGAPVTTKNFPELAA
jgi:hypothetical protein